MTEKKIQKFTFDGEDFNVMMNFEGWKIGFLRYSERFSRFSSLERHMSTDEAFILVEGKAVLYTDEENCQMEKCAVYNIPRGVWHHITVSPDATVVVVENSDTCTNNTERKMINDADS